MSQLSLREQDILEAIIRDYITNAVPVSSERVREISDINISSATFRAIMGDLEEAGYLIQPHTSAGRMPTQKGYRFFVDSCALQNSQSRRVPVYSYSDPEEMVHYVVSKTRLFGAYIDTEENAYIQFGMGEALRAPEFNDRKHVQAFADFIDMVQEASKVYHAVLLQNNESSAVFIEQENPVPKARALSVVVSDNNEGMLFLIGPPRMDYERVLRTLYSIESIL